MFCPSDLVAFPKHPTFDFGLNFTGFWSSPALLLQVGLGSAAAALALPLGREDKPTEHYSTDYNKPQRTTTIFQTTENTVQLQAPRQEVPAAAACTWCTTWICICNPLTGYACVSTFNACKTRHVCNVFVGALEDMLWCHQSVHFSTWPKNYEWWCRR